MKSHEWLNLVLRQPGLTTAQRAVAAALWSYMDMHGNCHPSMQSLADRAGIRKRDTVRTALDALVALGLLHRAVQPKGRLSTNSYRAVDNRSRGPVQRVTAVTRLTDHRRPVERVTQGGPSNGSQTIPRGTKGETTSQHNPQPPIVAYLADHTRIP